ncbi:MAG: pyridoxal phosphate-dependent aminotransferase [Myxococcales bacterium]|nr:MAG: pyridoxal phosphate-dependent aminotransferase [Myxococcales bacterium]
MQEGKTRYTPTAGVPELREAIARRTAADYGFAVQPSQVVVSCGAKHSIYLALAAVVDPGDEVLIPAPYWVSYPDMVKLVDGAPAIVETRPEDRFRLTPEGLARAITPKSRVLLLNSPSNPTGEVYARRELEALADVAVAHDLIVICDDIYEKLVFDGLAFASFAQVSDAARSHAIIINGVSKSAAMTGWRLGYMIAPEPVAKAVNDLQSQMTSHPTSFVQWAAIEALNGPQDHLPRWRAEYQARRDRMAALLNAIEGVRCPTPQGAFYAFADWRGLLERKTGGRRLDSDVAWAEYLLEEAHVAVVPGQPFGAPGFLRFSFATALSTIEAGIRRIAAAAAKTAA